MPKYQTREIIIKTIKTLESWHTAITDEADNNSNTLPAQYAMLLRKELEKHYIIIFIYSYSPFVR